MLPPLRSRKSAPPPSEEELGASRVRPEAPAGDRRFARFERAVEDVTRDRVPFYEEDDEWHYEREMRQMRERAAEGRRRPREESPPEPTPVLSETVLRVLVGDLAPQVNGALNFMAASQTARTMATLGAAAAVGLVLPKVLK